MAFWNGTTWLKDECTGKLRKFPTCDAARAAAQRAYEKAKKEGGQVVDRWYLQSHGEFTALFTDERLG